MRLLIMGAPGAGKGTQAQGIAARFAVPVVSTGAIFRENVARQTELGGQIEALLSSGEFVPDTLTEEVVTTRLDESDAAAGWLLDGFPRTLHQVQALDDYLAARRTALDAVISLEVPLTTLVSRLARRAEIEGRTDDTEETVRRRLDKYFAQTRPLLDHYQQRGLLVCVDGVGGIDQVGTRIAAELDHKLGERA